MKYLSTQDWRFSKIMNDLVTHLLSFRRFNRKKILRGGVLLFIQALAVYGWAFISAPLAVSPAGAIALAMLTLTGPAYWPAILLGSFVGLTIAHTSFLPLMVCSLSYTLASVIGARLFQAFEFNSLLSRLRDGVILLSVLFGTALIFPLLSFGMISLFPTSAFEASFLTGLTWSKAWMATAFSNLIYTPLILRWSYLPHQRSPRELFETGLLLGSVIAISGFLFWTDIRGIVGISFTYFMIIPLFWIALRLGPRMTVTALGLSASIGLASFLHEAYRYGTASVNLQQIFQTELFFVMLSTLFLLIVAIEEERKEKTKALEEHVSGLRTEIRELSDDDRLKNEFIATLAHELRNPLAPVVSTLELLLMKGELSRESLQLVKRVQHQTETVKHLLDDLLDVTRITQKKIRLRKEHRMLHELIGHCESNAHYVMQNYHHHFSLYIPPKDVPLYVDPTRFEQIVTNLLYNAAKYTEPGGKIELRCDTEGEKLIVRLRDNGIGIDAKNIEQIFLPFRQVRTKQHTGTGLGIGLAITKQLVEMHGGTITVVSEGLGKGSEFTVTLPIVEQSEDTPVLQPLSEGEDERPLHERTILVVDDNEDAAKALARLLEFRGHHAYVAHTGHEAIENTRLFKPEVILLDIGLPDMSGYDVARQLRQHGVHAKIIAVTGYGQEEDRLHSEEAGFDHHLVKPVGLQEVERFLS